MLSTLNRLQLLSNHGKILAYRKYINPFINTLIWHPYYC